MTSSTATAHSTTSSSPKKSNINHLTTPTTSDYLSMLQSFALTAENSTSSPLINLNVLPSPIHFPGLPGIVVSLSEQKPVLDSTSSMSSTNHAQAIKPEEDGSDVNPSRESEESLEVVQHPTIPLVEEVAAAISSSSVSKIPKLAEKNIQRLRAQTTCSQWVLLRVENSTFLFN